MRKLIVFLVVLSILAIVFSSCGKEQGTAGGSAAETTGEQTGLASGSTEDADLAVYSRESLTAKYTREIAGAYAEENKLPDSGTTAGMVELADKYAAQWTAVAEEYYQKLLVYEHDWEELEGYPSAEEFHAYISNMKSSWEQNYQVMYENYFGTLEYIYGTGTIVGPVAAQFRYNMQRDWALLILDICDQLGME